MLKVVLSVYLINAYGLSLSAMNSVFDDKSKLLRYPLSQIIVLP
jgi:hypothetical protein